MHNYNTITLIDGTININIDNIPKKFQHIFKLSKINTTIEMIEITLEILIDNKIIFDDIILYNVVNFLIKYVNYMYVIKYIYKIHTGYKILCENNNSMYKSIKFEFEHICKNNNKKSYIINIGNCLLLLSQ